MLLQLSYFPPSFPSTLHTPSHPQSPRFSFMSMGPTYESFGFSISYTFLNLPLFSTYHLCYLFSKYRIFLKDFIYLFLGRRGGREKERERNINVKLPLSCPLPGLQPRHVSWLGIEPVTLWFTFWLALNPLSHPSKGSTGGLFLGGWNDFVWHCNGGCVTLHLPKPIELCNTKSTT